jgi:hypothetical protein
MYVHRQREYSPDEVVQKTKDFLNDFIKLCPEWLPFSIPSSLTYCNKSFFDVPAFDILSAAIAEGNFSIEGSETTFHNNIDHSSDNFKKIIEIQMQLEVKGCEDKCLSSLVRFPPHTEETKQIVTKDFIKNVFDLFLKYWHPKNGYVLPSCSHIKRYIGTDVFGVGWLTYLSNELGEYPLLPDWVKIIPVEGYGIYIQVSDELPDYENESEFRKIAERIYELFKIIKPWLYPPQSVGSYTWN